MHTHTHNLSLSHTHTDHRRDDHRAVEEQFCARPPFVVPPGLQGERVFIELKRENMC